MTAEQRNARIGELKEKIAELKRAIALADSELEKLACQRASEAYFEREHGGL